MYNSRKKNGLKLTVNKYFTYLPFLLKSQKKDLTKKQRIQATIFIYEE